MTVNQGPPSTGWREAARASPEVVALILTIAVIALALLAFRLA